MIKEGETTVRALKALYVEDTEGQRSDSAVFVSFHPFLQRGHQRL